MTEGNQLEFPELVVPQYGDKKALDELFIRSGSYRKADNYLGLMQFISRLPTLSPFNAFLIHMQHRGVQ